MKKTLLLYIVMLMIWVSYSSPLAAQKFEFTPFAGYQTGANIKSYAGQFHINGGFDFGASISHRFGETYTIEVSYSRLKSDLTYTPDASTSTPVCNLAVSYISIGGIAEINPGDMVVPYAKIALGETFYTPINSDIESVNVLHFDIAGGAKFDISEHFGFRLQASLLLPVFFEGIYFQEAAPDPGQGMKTKIAGVQGNFTGGLILKF